MDCSEVVKNTRGSIVFIVTFDKENEIVSTGSGFVFFKEGIIVTCNHIVEDTNKILLKFSDDQKYMSGKVVVQDVEHDLALIKIDDKTRIPIPMGETSGVIEGMPIVFSGYPFSSQDLTTHRGIISAVTTDATEIVSFTIDGTINSGNSGCPLMNMEGEVIGVVSAKRRARNDILEKVEEMPAEAISVYGVDFIEIYQALINNIQLGVGYAVPAMYIPEHKTTSKKKPTNKKIKEEKK